MTKYSLTATHKNAQTPYTTTYCKQHYAVYPCRALASSFAKTGAKTTESAAGKGAYDVDVTGYNTNVKGYNADVALLEKHCGEAQWRSAPLLENADWPAYLAVGGGLLEAFEGVVVGVEVLPVGGVGLVRDQPAPVVDHGVVHDTVPALPGGHAEEHQHR
eukprot:2902149-Pyramimonas_sp.AAC.1